MKIIGLDFGTTNSTISYYNKESKSLDSFKDRAKDTDYIPTIVAYDKNRSNEISIGNRAKKNVTSKNYEAYEHFKLRLGKNSDEIIEGKDKTPLHVTQDFIKKLLDEYKVSQNIDLKENLDGIVMTVPETWFREASNRTARENIEGIFKKLGYSDSEFQLESEPVAAAAYFCWAYKENDSKGKEYNGHIVVIDYGGGTLDVTLCEANRGKIKILERCGYGEYNETNGCAGVAFDEAVVEKLIRDKGLPFKKDDPKFIKLRNDFEERKISECEKITEDLKDYYEDHDIMEGEPPLFSLEYSDDGDALDVYCKDLDQCFEEVNASKLRDSLKQIKQFFPVHKINSNSPENFKVLLVGGFSNFFAVENEVRISFDASTGDIDKRFEQPFPLKNRSLAISRGAALIASNELNIIHTCTHSYGYVRYGLDENDQPVPKNYIPVVDKGTDIKKLITPVFSDEKEYVRHPGGKLRIFIDDGRPDNAGRLRIALDESVKELFPNVDNNYQDKWYQFGFSVSKNQIPTIHIKDKHGKVISSTSLNKLIEKIGITQ
jgi:molecular chaperone DnaK